MIFRGRVPRHKPNTVLAGIIFPLLVVVLVAVAVGFNDVVPGVVGGIVVVCLDALVLLQLCLFSLHFMMYVIYSCCLFVCVAFLGSHTKIKRIFQQLCKAAIFHYPVN